MSVELQEERIKKVENKLGIDLLGDKPILKLDNEGKYRFIDVESENILDTKIQAIIDYVNNNDGRGKTEEEKDKIYGIAQDLYKDALTTLADTKFNLFFNRDQYSYLTDLLIKRMDYTVDTIFFAIDLRDTLVDMKENAKFTNDMDLGSFAFTATDVTYTYHLLKDHTVKGLQKSTFVFSEILRRIADVSKVFKYYDNAVKDSFKMITEWVAKFDEGVVLKAEKKK